MDDAIYGDAAKNKRVGSSVLIQKDKLSDGNRVWYTTENSIMVASLINYAGKKKFEDEIFVQEENEILSNIS